MEKKTQNEMETVVIGVYSDDVIDRNYPKLHGRYILIRG